LANATDDYIVIKMLQHFQHTTGTITAISEILNAKEFSSVGLPIQGMAYPQTYLDGHYMCDSQKNNRFLLHYLYSMKHVALINPLC
jgi:hypothetical protein